MTGIDAIAELFAGPGARDYLGEAVTIGEHMRQAGALAEAAGAPPPLVAAALLHDVGHSAQRDRTPGTAAGGARSGWPSGSAPAVTEPVRLHVAAKRYLCATEPGYFARLSPESVRTLALQGGPMTPEQAAAFAALPYARDAVAVRRWDDEAKDPSVTPPEFASLRAAAQPGTAAPGPRSAGRAGQGVDRGGVADAEGDRAAQVTVVGPLDRRPGQIGGEAALAQHRHPRPDARAAGRPRRWPAPRR